MSHAGIITVELSRVQHEDGGAAVFVRILKAEHLFDVKNTIVSTNLSDDKSSLRISLLLFFVYVVGGMLVYRKMEGWSWITCVYFATVVLTTVGYGDPVPTTPEAKLFTALYAIMGIAMLAGAVGVLGGAALEKLQDTGKTRERSGLVPPPVLFTQWWQNSIRCFVFVPCKLHHLACVNTDRMSLNHTHPPPLPLHPFGLCALPSLLNLSYPDISSNLHSRRRRQRRRRRGRYGR